MVESREICHENLVPHTRVQSPPSHQIQSRKKCPNVVHLTPLLICWVPVIVHGSCISVFLYLCFAVCLYFCISGLAPLLMCWSFCRFSVWGPEVRLSCRDGGQGGSLGGRRLRRGPGGHLSWGEILFNYLLPTFQLLPMQECKRHVKLMRGSDYFFGQYSHAQCAQLFTFLDDIHFQ